MSTSNDGRTRWETVEELAERLHTNIYSIRQRVKNGDLPAHRVPGSRRYLFDPAEVDQWIKEADIRSRCSSPTADEAA